MRIGLYDADMGRGRTRRGRERETVLTALALAAWWVLVLAPRAEAYIDPSAGGMLVQLLLAGTAGVAVLGKLMWSRIKRVLRRSRTPTSPRPGPSAARRRMIGFDPASFRDPSGRLFRHGGAIYRTCSPQALATSRAPATAACSTR